MALFLFIWHKKSFKYHGFCHIIWREKCHWSWTTHYTWFPYLALNRKCREKYAKKDKSAFDHTAKRVANSNFMREHTFSTFAWQKKKNTKQNIFSKLFKRHRAINSTIKDWLQSYNNLHHHHITSQMQLFFFVFMLPCCWQFWFLHNL